MKYEVILERNSFIKTLSLFKTKKQALAYMDFNSSLIEEWFEEPIEFNKFYCPSTRETTYESSDFSTKLMVRKLTK